MRPLSELFDLRGRVAVVTGGAGHLALAVAQGLAESGADLLLVDVAASACRERAERVAAAWNVRVVPLGLDLARSDAARRVIATCLRSFGRIDILVNNAAMTGASDLPGYAADLSRQSLGAWRRALAVNLDAAFALCQAAAEPLAKSGHGSIVNIASIYGVVGPHLELYSGTTVRQPAAYGASKAGLLQLTRYLSMLLAPRVRVNAISPGGIARGQSPKFQRRYRELTPLGRMAREEDFKGVSAFLASDASAYLTGQNIVVDGGWTAR